MCKPNLLDNASWACPVLINDFTINGILYNFSRQLSHCLRRVAITEVEVVIINEQGTELVEWQRGKISPYITLHIIINQSG